MGDYTKRMTGRHGPRGEKPGEEGVGFTVDMLRLPGQENSDDPVMVYRVIDRYDGEIVFNGVEVKSLAAKAANRQIFLMSKASGMADEVGLVETAIEARAPDNETEEETERRVYLEEVCVSLGRNVSDHLADGVGMALFIFDYGSSGHLAHCSTAKFADVLEVMREFIARYGAGDQ